MKYQRACASASRILGVLGVAIFIMAIVVRYALVGWTFCLFGGNPPTSVAHVVLGANTLILIALLFRSQTSCNCNCEKQPTDQPNPKQEK